MKNAMHDGDRENAKSIVQNLFQPHPSLIKNNPFLNRKKEIELELNLHTEDLYEMS